MANVLNATDELENVEDEVQITTEQTEMLIQFQEIVGKEDLEECKTILQQYDWNIANAVASFVEPDVARYDHTDHIPNINHLPDRNLSENSLNHLYSNSFNNVNTIIRPQPRNRAQGLLQWATFIFMFPFRFTISSLWDVFSFILTFFRPNPLLAVTNAIGDVSSFITEFKQTYGITAPNFQEVSYNQVLAKAKSDAKFLVVYLHDPKKSDSAAFCRDILCDNEFKDLITNSNAILWGCSITSPQGYSVAYNLRHQVSPYMAVICLKPEITSPNENVMTVAGKFSGFLELSEVIAWLNTVFTTNQRHLDSIKARHVEREINRQVVFEQNQAYNDSLVKDQEKARLKEEEKRKQRDAEAERIRLEEEVEERAKLIEIRKIYLRNSMLPEPDLQTTDAITVVFKLPGGKRIQRVFSKNNSIQDLYTFVFCQEDSPVNFQLVQNFPCRQLPYSPSNIHELSLQQIKSFGAWSSPEDTNDVTVGDAKLSKQEVLFVQDNDA